MDQINKLLSFNLDKNVQKGGASNNIGNIISNTYYNFKEFLFIIISPIIFGAFLPTIPFFIVMAIMYGSVKFLINYMNYNK